ncbi:unnamed protein product [Caenorhabditis auriculariae]|uniref:Uncharacterized protein n=1 Tax=Caenorhabditis auriculariae TaxID=2777116 RepID=A0A8S1HMC4_9PELO|nr:unnamed protein product [Caenorhabditis auriculariae]
MKLLPIPYEIQQLLNTCPPQKRVAATALDLGPSAVIPPELLRKEDDRSKGRQITSPYLRRRFSHSPPPLAPIFGPLLKVDPITLLLLGARTGDTKTAVRRNQTP